MRPTPVLEPQVLYQRVWFYFIGIREPWESLSRVIWSYLLFRNKTGSLEDGLDWRQGEQLIQMPKQESIIIIIIIIIIITRGLRDHMIYCKLLCGVLGCIRSHVVRVGIGVYIMLCALILLLKLMTLWFYLMYILVFWI